MTNDTANVCLLTPSEPIFARGIRMTRVAFAIACFAYLVFVLQSSAFPQAQDPPPQLGIPPGTTITGGPDVISLSTLGIHFEIPVHGRTGRGINFSFNMNIDNPSYSKGVDNSGVLRWLSTMGVLSVGGLNGLGAVTYSVVPNQCFDENHEKVNYNEYWFSSFQDSQGTSHSFSDYKGLLVTNMWPEGGGTCTNRYIPSAGGPSWDGSGIGISVTGGLNPKSATVYLPNGTVIIPPLVAKTGPGPNWWGWTASGPTPFKRTDSNGNWITETLNGLQLANLTDTLGTVALTTSAIPPNPVSYTYKNSAGASVSFIQSFKTYTVRTAFGCPGIAEFPTASMSLLDRITLPNGTYYEFK